MLSIHVDQTARAIYFALRPGYISKTVVTQEWPLVAVDYDQRGRALGIETVGHKTVKLNAIFRTAKVKQPSAREMASAALSLAQEGVAVA